MFKRMLPWLTMIVLVIIIFVLGGFILWEYIMKDDTPLDPNGQAQAIVEEVEGKHLSAKDREQLTYNINDVTTNLSELNYLVKISFSFVVDNELAREEIEMIEPLVLDIIGNTLADTHPEEIIGSHGRDALKSILINRINPRLEEGNVLEINLSDFIISQR